MGKLIIRNQFGHLRHCEVGDYLHHSVGGQPLLLYGLLQIRNCEGDSVAHENFAEMLQLFGSVEVEGVAHYAECCVVYGERDAVAVKNFAPRRGEAYHPQPVAVRQAYVFVALVYLA